MSDEYERGFTEAVRLALAVCDEPTGERREEMVRERIADAIRLAASATLQKATPPAG